MRADADRPDRGFVGEADEAPHTGELDGGRPATDPSGSAPRPADSPAEPVGPSESPTPSPPADAALRTALKVSLLALLAVAVFGGGYLLGRTGGEGAGKSTIKNISLEQFNDRLKQMRGKPVVVNFWASWCGPCRKEAPALQRAHDKYKSKGLQVLGVNSGDTAAGADGFLKEFKINYPNVRDASDEISVAYRVNGLPTTFFFDRDGDIVDTAVGALDEKAFNQYLADFVE